MVSERNQGVQRLEDNAVIDELPNVKFSEVLNVHYQVLLVSVIVGLREVNED
jgi:hypothetical protein